MTRGWKDRWVCIGGGTAGFGLELAHRWADAGAHVALLGRDPNRLAHAIADVQSRSRGEVIGFGVDLRDPTTFETSGWNDWLAKAKLAAAVAAAGRSDRGYLMQLSPGEILELFEINVLTALNFSQACREALGRDRGTLVHIASLAGIVAAPGLGGYPIAKHGVVALSRQLRVELSSQGIKVLLVCPGPIGGEGVQRGRYDRLAEARKLPAELKQPAGGAPLRALDPRVLSDRILRSALEGRKELILPGRVRWLAGLGTLWPSLFDFFLKRQAGRENP